MVLLHFGFIYIFSLVIEFFLLIMYAFSCITFVLVSAICLKSLDAFTLTHASSLSLNKRQLLQPKKIESLRRFVTPNNLFSFCGGATGNSLVKEFTDLQELEKLLSSSPGLVVIDFTATWCGPCKMIAPHFKAMADSEEYKSVTFVKVDVDAGSEIAQHFGVMAMPTFIFVRNNEIVHQFSGASLDNLKNVIHKLK